jgi:hypothetical protein
MAREKMKDIIVLLPGILGSTLQKNGKDVWGISAGAVSNALWNLGANVQDLAIPDDQHDNPDYDDGVTATRLIPDAHLIPWFWKIDGYTLVSKTLKEHFELEEGRNYFEFAYDWRRDNRIAARRLWQQSRKWLADWRESSGNQDARLILIAHSMGGMVARYFLEVLEGWRDTRLLTTFGTPYRGSVNALNFIVNGLVKKVGFITLIDLSKMLRSFTSVYQLLPIYPCLDQGDGNLIKLDEAAGVPNLDAQRVKGAFNFQQEINDAVAENLKSEDYRDNGYSLHPVVGIYQPTFQSAQFSGGVYEAFQEYKNEDLTGDGTVPRISAIPLEMKNQNSAIFASEQHASLQNAASVLWQVRGLLSGLSIDFDKFKDLTGSQIGLEIDDAFEVAEPITVRARTEKKSNLTATIDDINTNAVIARSQLNKGIGEWQTAEFPPLSAGSYRVNVFDEKTEDYSVSDLFLVLP